MNGYDIDAKTYYMAGLCGHPIPILTESSSVNEILQKAYARGRRERAKQTTRQVKHYSL